MADGEKTDKRKSLKSRLGRGFSLARNSSKELVVYVNKSEKIEINLKPTDPVRDIFKVIENHRKVKIDPLTYQLKTDSGIIVNLQGVLKSLSSTELYLHPPLENSEQNKVFAKTLQEAIIKSSDRVIPTVLRKSFEFLEKERCLRTVGLFRLNGSRTEVERLQGIFDKGDIDNYEFPSNTDPHIVAGLIKKYFAELKDSVIPFDFFESFTSLGDIDNEVERMKKIGEIVKRLPPQNYQVLKFVLEYLVKLCMYTNKNLITPGNISVVWGGLFLKNPNIKQFDLNRKLTQEEKVTYIRLVGCMIENFGEIFGFSDVLDNKMSAVESMISPQSPEQNETKSSKNLKDFVALMKNATKEKKQIPSLNLKKVKDVEDDGEDEVESLKDGDMSTKKYSTMRPKTSRTRGTLKGQDLGSLMSFAQSFKSSNAAPPPPPPPPLPASASLASINQSVRSKETEKLDSETEETLTKLIDEWKRKYNEEVHARQKDKESAQKIQEQWKDLNEQNSKQISHLKQEIENHKESLRLSETKLSITKQKYELELDTINREKQILAEKYEKEIDQLMETIQKLKDERQKMTLAPNNAKHITDSSNMDDTSSMTSESNAGTRKKSIVVSSRFRSASTLNQQDADKDTGSVSAPTPEAETTFDPENMCSGCQKVLSGSYVTANGKKYHSNCFTCNMCKKRIQEGFIEQSPNQYICKSCSNPSASPSTSPSQGAAGKNKGICSQCGDPIMKAKDKILALGKSYHRGCFCCSQCGSEFENMKFYNVNGEPTCATCKKNSKN